MSTLIFKKTRALAGDDEIFDQLEARLFYSPMDTPVLFLIDIVDDQKTEIEVSVEDLDNILKRAKAFIRKKKQG